MASEVAPNREPLTCLLIISSGRREDQLQAEEIGRDIGKDVCAYNSNRPHLGPFLSDARRGFLLEQDNYTISEIVMCANERCPRVQPRWCKEKLEQLLLNDQ